MWEQRKVSAMFELIKKIISQNEGLTVYYYPEMNDIPICIKYKPGEAIRPPENISKDGYVIEGWYKSRKYTNKGKPKIMAKLLKSVSLYAKWKLVEEAENNETRNER